MARMMPDLSEWGGEFSNAFSAKEDCDVDGGSIVDDAFRARSWASSSNVGAKRGWLLASGEGGAAIRTTDLNASRN